jgi:hypothetical protein
LNDEVDSNCIHCRDRNEEKHRSEQEVAHAVNRKQDAKREKRHHSRRCIGDESPQQTVNDAGGSAGNGSHQQNRDGALSEDWNSAFPMRDDPHHHATADS